MQKSFPAKIKAAQDGSGEFEAMVSTYDVDSTGDRVVPGAFAKSLEAWKASGNPIPVVWSHNHGDPFSHIGVVKEAEERPATDDAPGGLYVKAQLDITDNPTAQQVYRLLKGGRVTQYSFAYDVLDYAPDEADKGVTDLKELKLYEVGPTLIGANQETRTLAVKHGEADGAKSGRTLSAKNEADIKEAVSALRKAASMLDGVLSQVAESGKSGQPDPAASDESALSGKSDATVSGPPLDDAELRIRLEQLKGEG